jgi:hypothetical protein
MRDASNAQAYAIAGVRNGRNNFMVLSAIDHGGDERHPHQIPDLVTLPVQYYEGAKRARFLCGERRLMLALLADAICCLLSVGPRFEQLREETHDWLAGCGPSPVSFESACEAIGLDPKVTRVIENLVARENGPELRAYPKTRSGRSGRVSVNGFSPPVAHLVDHET